MSWGPGRQNPSRLAQSSAGPSAPRAGPHDYSPSAGADQRVVNGGMFNKSHTNLWGYMLNAKQPHTTEGQILFSPILSFY